VVCLFIAMAASVTGYGAPIADSGGRDVSVALFSTRSLHAVTITPVGSGAWLARCATCAHEALTTPLHVAGRMDVLAGGMLKVTDDASGEGRTAAGLWHLRASGGGVDVVLTLPSERYVAAVLNAEAAAGEPPESLRALAILARTYALHGRHYVAQPGHLTAELCDSTECQAMIPGPVSQAIEDATWSTAGETLWFGGRRAKVFFSQSCGGVTEDGGTVWPGLRGVSYLRSHADPYCVRRDAAAWHAEVTLAEFGAIAKAEGWRLPEKIVAARVAERSVSHRALRIAFSGSGGATGMVSASALRFGIGRALGWNRVRSDAYEVGVRNGAVVFDGKGHGHGVGLCQEGSAEMATEGKSAREILAFYFPGTAVRILAGDEGWQVGKVGPIRSRVTEAMSAGRKAELEGTWREALKRFPPRREVDPEIVFAPTTEMFRQMTGQPGWELASMKGGRIVLQPVSILRQNGKDVPETLLHEMLHVLVEGEASGRAPLWLREGLVEVLAGDAEKGVHGAMTTAEIESALGRTDSLRASQHAHTAAAAKVRTLMGRYGFSTVRGWLSTGVPSGVE
jgi:stage II sporulation protein D